MTRQLLAHLAPRFNVLIGYAALAGTLLHSASAQAGLIGINSPGTSIASINFDDTNSSKPPIGVTNTGPSVSPWNGPAVTLSLITDPNTGDFAKGQIDAMVTSPFVYALNFNSVTLNQAVGNTGYATLAFTFNAEFQLDSLGLPSQATLFPNFNVNGTVQSSSGSYASVKGYINYTGITSAGTIGVLDTVTYNSVWNTPGAFSGTATGTAMNGFTPTLVGGTTLTLDGIIIFTVDPAEINAQSVQSVPEPSSFALLCLGTGGLAIGAIRHRRRELK